MSEKSTPSTKFSSKIGFIAAAASSAVGVGNIWRFPYTVGEYGGAGFLILYIFFVCLLGFPLVLAKLAFGRKMQAGPFNAYKKSGNFTLLGTFAAFVSFVIISFYNVISGWLIGYFYEISNGTLLKTTDFSAKFGEFIADPYKNLILTGTVTIIVGVIVLNGISEGIEKISKILMPLFIVLMLGLIVYSITLPGSSRGLMFYLIPSWDTITPQAMYAALSQSFLSLSIGSGILITYGAYVNKKDDLVKSSAIVSISDTLVSFLSGLIIFPIIFHKGISPAQGPSLIFISLPLAFKGLGKLVGIIVGAIFFALLVFAAITSAISLLEVVVKYVMERFKVSRRISVAITSISCFLLSIPSILSFDNGSFLHAIKINNKVSYSFFGMVSCISFDVMMPLGGLAFCLFVSYKYKLNTLMEEIYRGYKSKFAWLKHYLIFSIKYAAPILITIAVMLKLYEIWNGISIS